MAFAEGGLHSELPPPQAPPVQAVSQYCGICKAIAVLRRWLPEAQQMLACFSIVRLLSSALGLQPLSPVKTVPGNAVMPKLEG